MTRQDQDDKDNQPNIVTKLVNWVLNEPVASFQLEKIPGCAIPHLAGNEEEGEQLDARISKLLQAMGGPPEVIIHLTGRPAPRYDLYPEAAFGEIREMHKRAREAVARCVLLELAVRQIQRPPETWNPDMPEYVVEVLRDDMTRRLWDALEQGLIRLASYWDRVGQFLDFAYFGTRQFERDGFASVVNRIHVNVVPILQDLSASDGWAALRRFATADSQENALPWLLRRRNLLVHSVHLHGDAEKPEEDPIFESAHNQLDETVRKKLRPGSSSVELERLRGQYVRTVELFGSVLDVSEVAARWHSKPRFEERLF